MRETVVANKQPLKGVQRVEVFARDFDETKRFWGRLGFQVTIKGEVGGREGSLRAGDLFVRVLEDPQRAGDRRQAPLDPLRLVFACRGFDSYLDTLRGKGVAIPEPSRQHGLVRAVELVDPNGIRVMLEDGGA